MRYDGYSMCRNEGLIPNKNLCSAPEDALRSGELSREETLCKVFGYRGCKDCRF